MLSRGCILLLLQYSESRCVLYINTKNITAPTRDREYGRGEKLADAENCYNGFFSDYATLLSAA